MECPSCDFEAAQADFGNPLRCPDCGAFYEKALKLKLAEGWRAGENPKPVDVDGERVFLESSGVKVTNARFITSGRTYAMASVNSVKVVKQDKTPSKGGAVAMIVIGVLGMLGASSGASKSLVGMVLFAALIGMGAWWLKSIKQRFLFTIMLTTSSGESAALESYSEQDIRRVETALSDAIIYRG